MSDLSDMDAVKLALLFAFVVVAFAAMYFDPEE